MAPIVEPILSEFREEIPATRRVLERVPADRLTWKPHPKSRSLGELATHVAELARWGIRFQKDSFQIGSEAAPPMKTAEVFVTIPRHALLRSVLLSHLIHHRGQLTVYLRENDVPLPSIYGPTADEPI